MPQLSDEEIQKQLNLKETPAQTKKRVEDAQKAAMQRFLKGLMGCQ